MSASPLSSELILPRPTLRPALAFALAATLLASSAARAQESASAEPDTSFLAGETAVPAIGLTLDQAQRLATANSPAGRSALAAWRSARGARMREAGNFDPALTGELSRTSADSRVNSPFAGSESRQHTVAGGLSWLSPIGTSLNFSLSQIKAESNSQFTTLPTERRARARFDFVQPLFGGFGLAASRGELRALDRELEAAARRLGAATLDVGAAVEVAYWQLYAAERDLQVERIQRQRAAVFLRDQLLRSRAGAAGPGAVAAARRFLAEQEAVLIDVRLAYRGASDHLNEVMGVASGNQDRLHCTEEPPSPAAVMPLDAALQLAYRNNGALLAGDADAAAALARFRRAARNAWPTVEAFGGYGGSGLAGIGQPVVFGTDTIPAPPETDFGEAWRQVWDDSNPDWSFGVRARVPIGWRSNRGERERQRGNYERAREAARAQRLALENQVRAAHRESEQSQEALRAMRTLTEAAREQARIGRLEFQAGRTTAYDLVGIEADLARAEFQESQVLVRVARAATELRRLTQAPPETAK
jgi:outer membrane protein TolC